MAFDKQDLRNIPYIDDVRSKKLKEAGINNMDELAMSEPEKLMSMEGFSRNLVSRIQAFLESEYVEETSEEDIIDEEMNAQILEWATEGYDVEDIEKEVMESDDPEKVMDKYSEKIEKLNEIKNNLLQLNVFDCVSDAEEILDMLKDPNKVKQVEKNYQELLKKLEVRDLKHELERIKVPELESRINAVFEKLDETNEVESVQVEVADIKRDFKENFFVKEFLREGDEEPQKTVKVDAEKTPEKKGIKFDAFYLFHRKKGFPLIKWYKHDYTPEREIETVRKIVNGLRKIGEDKESVPPNNLKIINTKKTMNFALVGGRTVVLGADFEGEISKWEKMVLIKAVKLLEKQEFDTLKKWDRTVELSYQEKVMKSLLRLSMNNRE